jgi:hypothetical protein
VPVLRCGRLAAAIVVVFAALIVAAPEAVATRTLVSSPTRIVAFAQDDRFVAWTVGRGGRFCSRGRAFIRNLESGRQRSFAPRFDPGCLGGIVVDRGRALWAGAPISCGICFGATLYTASLATRHAIVREFIEVPQSGGAALTGVAGDGGLLAYSWVGYAPTNDCEPTCAWAVTRGRVIRGVVNRVRLPGSAAVLAAGAGRLAFAPARRTWQGSVTIRPVRNGPVRVVNARTGDPVMVVSPTGIVRTLALSRRALAVFVRRADGSRVIERYAIPSGRLLAATAVADDASRTLDIAYKWIVYRVGHQIRIVDARGSDHLLVRPTARPIGVSIEGRRVAWAENKAGRHRIRALLAPG